MTAFCRGLYLGLAILFGWSGPCGAQNPQVRPEETEVWEPVPPVVTPSAAAANWRPPSDAITLFDGSDLDEWVDARDGSPSRWVVSGGVVTVNKASGHLQTKRTFTNY